MRYIFKKNQIIITVLAALIILAGYLNLVDNHNNKQNPTKAVGNSDLSKTDTNGNDETKDMINQDGALENQTTDVLNELDSLDTDIDMEPGSAIIVNGPGKNAIVIEAKLSKEQVRAANKQLLMTLINNANISTDERQEIIAQIIEMTKINDKEMAAENTLRAKGYVDCVVTITNKTVEVIVSKEELTDTMRAQIEDVVKRTTEVEVSKITIVNLSR